MLLGVQQNSNQSLPPNHIPPDPHDLKVYYTPKCHKIKLQALLFRGNAHVKQLPTYPAAGKEKP